MAACERMEAEARAEAEAARPAYEDKKAAYDAKKGRRGRPPKPPDDAPPPERQSNLTDPDSALMRRSDAHEYRQAYNAQAVVDADGSQLVLATHVTRCPVDAPSFLALILAMAAMTGLPRRVLADAGLANGEAVAGCSSTASTRWSRSRAPSRTGPTASTTAGRRQATPHHAGPVADRDEGQDGDRRCQSPIQKAQADRRAGCSALSKSALGFRHFLLRGINKAARSGHSSRSPQLQADGHAGSSVTTGYRQPTAPTASNATANSPIRQMGWTAPQRHRCHHARTGNKGSRAR